MNLDEAFSSSEQALIHRLGELQSGVSDATGKGLATEGLIEERLLRPYLRPGMECVKGEVAYLESDTVKTSPPIDRIVYSANVCSPLIFEPTHSVIPVECLVGVVEITMRLDARKLAMDVEHTRRARDLRNRHYYVSVPATQTRVLQVVSQGEMGCRAFIVGLPADPQWSPQTIADAFLRVQSENGGTLVHGLYVLGIGFFETVTQEPGTTDHASVRAWLGPDRLFRFVTSFRMSLDRWPHLSEGLSADLSYYVRGGSQHFDGQ